MRVRDPRNLHRKKSSEPVALRRSIHGCMWVSVVHQTPLLASCGVVFPRMIFQHLLVAINLIRARLFWHGILFSAPMNLTLILRIPSFALAHQIASPLPPSLPGLTDTNTWHRGRG